MFEKDKFDDYWDIIKSLKSPDGPGIYEHNGEVELIVYADGGRELESCTIGDTLDVIFNEDGTRRTPDELVSEVDRVAYQENGIEVEYDEYMIDEILVAIFDDAEGLTRNEYLEKKERERVEEALMNSDVD